MPPLHQADVHFRRKRLRCRTATPLVKSKPDLYRLQRVKAIIVCKACLGRGLGRDDDDNDEGVGRGEETCASVRGSRAGSRLVLLVVLAPMSSLSV